VPRLTLYKPVFRHSLGPSTCNDDLRVPGSSPISVRMCPTNSAKAYRANFQPQRHCRHLLFAKPRRSCLVVPSAEDERGVYAFEWLPPESYRIEQDLPGGWGAPSHGADGMSAVDLMDQDPTRIGCRPTFARVQTGKSRERRRKPRRFALLKTEACLLLVSPT
jgi:hypothetical protein